MLGRPPVPRARSAGHCGYGSIIETLAHHFLVLLDVPSHQIIVSLLFNDPPFLNYTLYNSTTCIFSLAGLHDSHSQRSSQMVDTSGWPSKLSITLAYP